MEHGGRVHNQSDPLAVEPQFFSSLIGGDVAVLDRILGDDFLLIDVMTGSEVKKTDLLAVLKSGQFKFGAIKLVESRVRLYGITAVIIGRTHMNGRFGETPFTASSRYTHVFVKEQSQWRLVSAQGTQVVNTSVNEPTPQLPYTMRELGKSDSRVRR
jgi:hypothetical protein